MNHSIIIAILCTCLSISVWAEGPIKTMAGKKWKLVSMKSRGKEAKAQKRKPYFTVKKDGNVSGHSSVNRFFGGVKEVDGKLKWGPMGSTRMAGPPALMKQGQAFLKNLSLMTQLTLDKKKLVLSNDDGTVSMTFSVGATKK